MDPWLTRRRLPPVVIGLVVAVVLLGAGFGAWRHVTSGVADDLEVAWVGAPACTGTTVVADDESGHENVIQARAGMHCVITVRVTNHGGRDVELGRAVAALLGRSRAVVRAEPRSAWAAFPSQDSRGLDAFLDLDVDLAPDESMEFEVPVGFRDSGCNNDTTVYASPWPTVEIRTLGRSLTVGGEDEFVYLGAGRASGCLPGGGG
jgi:hypothetical protein